MRLTFSLVLFVFMFQPARADVQDMIEFRTELALQSTIDAPLKPWAASERKFVTQLFQSLEAKSPNLLARAAQAGKIMLYRAATTPDHPSAGWVRRRHESSFIFADLFFLADTPSEFTYIERVFIHEITHLADPVDQIARSPEWSKIIEPRLASVSQVLTIRGLTMRQAMFKRLDSVATPFGFPNMYAATSRHEALAEFTAAIYAGKIVPDDVDMFIRLRVLTKPKPIMGKLAKSYQEGYLYYREKQFDKAIAVFDDAIDLSPSFSQGWYIRGYVHINAGHNRLAIRDFSAALNLIPLDDLKPRQDLLSASVAARERIANWPGVVSDCSRLIEQTYKQSYYYARRGNAYLKMKNMRLAVKDFQSALEHNPKNRQKIEELLEYAQAQLKKKD